MSRASQRRGPALFGSQNMQSKAPNYNVSVRAEEENRDHRSRDPIPSASTKGKLTIFASVASHTRLLPVSGSQFRRFSQATFYHLINLIYRLNGLCAKTTHT